MPTVEINANRIQWPNKCCRCGTHHYTCRQHTDKVVLRTTLSVTAYRKIGVKIPVCNRCAFAQYIWFGAAIVLAGLGYFALEMSGAKNNVPSLVPVAFVGAVILAIVGVNKRPIKILGFNEEKNTIKLNIYNKQIADELSSRSNLEA